MNDAPQHVATSLDMSRPVKEEGEFSHDMPRHVQTEPGRNDIDMSRHVRTEIDKAKFTLTVKEASEMFAEAGVPRSTRAITRYCKQGEIEYIVVDTEKNSKFLIDKTSVERRIEQLRQSVLFAEEEQQEVSRHVEAEVKNDMDMSRHVQTENQSHATTSRDMSRQHEDDQHRETPTRVDMIHLDERERGLYEKILNTKDDQIKILTEQLGKKDGQIETMNKHYERFFASERDTKIMTGRLQSLMNAIWPRTSKADGADHFVPANEA